MPGRREQDSTVGRSIVLEVAGTRVAVLTEVSGLALERDVIEIRQTAPDGTTVIRKLPGQPLPGEVVLSRVLTGDRLFEQWVADASLGGGVDASSRRTALVVLDQAGQVVATFTLSAAWPRKLEVGGLRAGASETPTEHLVLVHEGVARE